MPDNKGWLTKDDAHATGLPIWIKQNSQMPGRWTDDPYKHAVLLTKTRCKELKIPVLNDGMEAPCAFRYANGALSSYRYVPLFDRTSVFEKGELLYSVLKDGERMGSTE